MTQDLFILGANGNVGRTLVGQIFEKGDTNSELHENPTKIVGLANIDSYIYKASGLSMEQCYSFSRKKDTEKRYGLMELLDVVKENPSDGKLTFVDVTAAKEPMHNFHVHLMENTNYGMVTSNKNPVTMVDTAGFVNLVKNTSRYGLRCSVMAGANAIDEIKDFKDLGDSVRSIEGCFSGTLGYICSELEKGIEFSKIVKTAKQKGYTEPHPMDDLSGMDVAKKLLILSRTAGLKIDMNDISVSPFINEKYFKKDVNEFLTGLTKLDDKMARDMAMAKKDGKTLRYVAQLDYDEEKSYLSVSPRWVPKNSPLGTLNGTLNKIVIATDTYTIDQPCIIEAPGAGLEVTAQNVRRDLLQQIKSRAINYNGKK